MTGDLKTSSIEIVLDAKSINTGNKKRDGHLMDSDYLASDSIPTMTFKSTSIDTSSHPTFKYIAKGNLTIKGITKQVEMPFNYLGEAKRKDKEGNPKPSIFTFEGETVVSREDFGIATGSMSLGQEVTVRFSIEAGKK